MDYILSYLINLIIAAVFRFLSETKDAQVKGQKLHPCNILCGLIRLLVPVGIIIT
jgi:uncharacterized membrane protein YhaH (DUF805 family)